jgi:hypothetical protein
MYKSFVLIIPILLTSCAGTAEKVYVNTLGNEANAISYSAEFKSIVVKSNKESQFCAEPSPDTAMSSSVGESEDASLLGKKEGLSYQSGTNATSLGGRNSTVLLAREIFYRICEMGVNKVSTFKQQSDVFLKSLDTIIKLGDDKQSGSYISGGIRRPASSK